ncbi:uncharacterized protein [Blastocystis hominis]|uniref:Rho-GAP domain-containing protein n=1 Tax=Blastocystis hominis TaxID=12968 RepID=D8M0P6_BLAHO|nr:uncharacterized protein [Blastocystis hominis]CBK21635.2 unnamed protein product [Blastocystis hominis]|eukprot:XP_012895683.1 uncharacterized protein [Blastocystis hominis]
MLIFKSKSFFLFWNWTINPFYSIQPPPEKALELPKEWLTTDLEEQNSSKWGEKIVKQIYKLHIDEEMRNCEPEYTTLRDLKFWLGTWNVNGKKIDENINIWLTGSVTGKPTADIYVVGLEEMVDLTATTVVLEAQSQKRAGVWLEMVSNALNRGAKNDETSYVLIEHQILVGVFLSRDGRDDDDGCDGSIGHDGKQGRRCDPHEAYGQHGLLRLLASGGPSRERGGSKRGFPQVRARRWVNGRICDNIRFKTEDETFGILDHQLIFWIGDLNYRITSDVPTLRVFDYARDDLDYLLKKDQLKVSQRAGLAFEEFTEPEVKFPPTYKYKKYTTQYDKKEGKKCRAPAWCDRILYKTGDGASMDDIEVLTYDHIMKLSGSDHKPIFCEMNVRVKEYDPAKRKKIQLRIERELKKSENSAAKVHVELSGDEIDFGKLKYRTPERRTLTISNEGEGNAYFHFLPKAEDSHICKRLFNVSKAYGVVKPNEKLDIEMEALIDPEAAHELNGGHDVLHDVLVLRVEHDRDYYITMFGDYVMSCFGQSLENLIRMKAPARESSEISSNSPVAMAIPKELWRMVDYMMQYGCDSAGLWTDKGIEGEDALIRDMLDEGRPFEGIDVHSMADCLLDWFRALQSPLIPEKCTSRIEKGEKINSAFVDAFMNMMSPVRKNVFVYMIMFLRELLKHAESNDLTAEFLGMIFSQVFIVNASKKQQLSKEYRVAQEMVTELLIYLLKSTAQQLAGEVVAEDSGSEASDED